MERKNIQFSLTTELIGHQIITLAKDVTEIKEVLKNIQMNTYYKNVVHSDTMCNSCQRKPIIGIRYKCLQCDYDLCEYCIDLANHQQDHFFCRITNPIIYEFSKKSLSPPQSTTFVANNSTPNTFGRSSSYKN